VTTLAEYAEHEEEAERIGRWKQPRDHLGRFTKRCWSCGVYPPDAPNGLCPGCEAYRDHQR
jgi:hypothetical protein